MSPPDDVPNAETSATAFITSYVAAMALSYDPTSTASSIASALVSHYAPTFTAHDHGHTISAPPNDPTFWLTGVTSHLKRFQKSGLGWNMAMESYSVEDVGEREARCFVTWSVEPLDREGWSWMHVYFWRDEGEVSGEGG